MIFMCKNVFIKCFICKFYLVFFKKYNIFDFVYVFHIVFLYFYLNSIEFIRLLIFDNLFKNIIKCKKSQIFCLFLYFFAFIFVIS